MQEFHRLYSEIAMYTNHTMGYVGQVDKIMKVTDMNKYASERKMHKNLIMLVGM